MPARLKLGATGNLLRYEIESSDALSDLTTVTAVRLFVKTKTGTESIWTATILSQTVALLVATYTPSDVELGSVGELTISAELTAASKTYFVEHAGTLSVVDKYF